MMAQKVMRSDPSFDEVLLSGLSTNPAQLYQELFTFITFSIQGERGPVWHVSYTFNDQNQNQIIFLLVSSTKKKVLKE